MELNRLKKFLAPLLAAIFYGSWAYYANPTNTAFSSFWIQAVGSFFVTIILQVSVQSAIHKVKEASKCAQIFAISSVSWGFIGVLALIHYYMKSHNIFLILMPSLVVSWTYSLMLLYSTS